MTVVAMSRARWRPRLAARAIANPWAVVAFTVYLGLGAYLAFGLHAYYGDAYSRVANAYYVLFSRDPHLAAIGFVWMPLPSLVELLLLPLRGVFPGIAEQGFAANLMSAGFMALAVAVLDGILRDFGLRRAVRLGLLAAFALHPMIVYYGANGASEAPTIFFALIVCRYLARYLAAGDARSLVGIGIGLAGGYLTRYETAAAAVGVSALILGVSLVRLPGTRRARIMQAAADIAVAIMPFVLVFVGWAVAGWLLVGSPFSQFTSEYGNTSQMRAGASSGGSEVGLSIVASSSLAGLRLLMLSVAVPFGLVAALGVVAVRRDVRPLAVAAVFAPMIGFMVLAYVVHLISPWLRYFILAVPFGVLLLACLVAAPTPRGIEQEAGSSPRRLRFPTTFARALVPIVVVFVGLAAIPIAAMGMLDRTVAREESLDIAPLLGAGAGAPDRPGSQIHSFAAERAVAQYVDAMGLPRGSVLVDAFLGFPILLQSHRPELYVITPDRDFRPALADPRTFGVHYLLVPGAQDSGLLDAVNRSYPNLPRDTRFAEAVRVFPAIGGSPTWTLYKIVGSP